MKKISSFIDPPPPPLNPMHRVRLFGKQNTTISVWWMHPEYDGLVPDNYTIFVTHVHFVTFSTTNETTLTLPYNELQNIRIATNNCIGMGRTTSFTFLRGNEC